MDMRRKLRRHLGKLYLKDGSTAIKGLEANGKDDGFVG